MRCNINELHRVVLVHVYNILRIKLILIINVVELVVRWMKEGLGVRMKGARGEGAKG